MKSEVRHDRGTIEVTGRDGDFLRARVVFAATGVYPYVNSSGEIKYEAKLPEDLFSDVTINSAKGAPITDDHPPAGVFVDTTNYKEYVKGTLGDTITVVDKRKLEAVETIYDPGLIADLEAGKKLEVSIGFRLKLDPTPGEFEGKKYDAKQTNIIINHIAHVDSGRAGEEVRAYLDSADGNYAVQIDEEKIKKLKLETRRDGMTWEELVAGLKKLLGIESTTDSDDSDDDDKNKKDPGNSDNPDEDKNKKGDSDSEDPDDEDDKKTDSKDIKKLQKLLKKETARADASEALIKEMKSMFERQDKNDLFDKAVNRKIELIEVAKSIVPDFRHDKLSERDIMLKVIEQALPFESGTRIDKLDNVYIEARYDAALSYAKARANEQAGSSAAGSRIDQSAINEKRAKRLSMMEETK